LFVPHEIRTLLAWRETYLRERIVPRIPAAARGLLEKHRGDLVIVVTATNRFLTEPIAEELGVENLIATEPEMRDGRFTGEVAGTPSFREGKVVRVNEWLRARGHALEAFDESWFYSDSINDAPLLGAVSHPVVVDPGAQLEKLATGREWPILRLQR
jgi:HAD superfamily hydrolase (TIGR01490 family)